MIELFNQCGAWLSENAGSIVALLTGTNFVSLIAAIISMIKLFANIKTNKASINNLNTATDNLNEKLSQIKKVEDFVSLVMTGVSKMESGIKTFQNMYVKEQEAVNAKVNAMLEVQQLVYSTIKDDAIRTNVQTLLANAKLAEQKTKEALEAKVTELNQIIENLSSQLKIAIESKTPEVEETITQNVESIPMRG